MNFEEDFAKNNDRGYCIGSYRPLHFRKLY